MLKAYKVAGCTFHLELPESEILQSRLTQYDPFETEPVEDPVFTLGLVKELEDVPLEVAYDAPVEPGETVVRLYRAGEGWQFEMAPNSEHPISGRMRSNGDFTSGALQIPSKRISDAIFAINNSLMLLFAFSTAGLGVLEMHASVIRNSGKAFLFLAKSGTGKSTHSSLWLKHVPGSDLMNDDNPIVRVWPDGRVICYGSPWSGKTPCYRNIECPVGAFVRIRRCSENKIERLGILDSYALIYSSSSGYKTDRQMADYLHNTIEKTVTSCDCYVLDCRPDKEAAEVCSKQVLGL